MECGSQQDAWPNLYIADNSSNSPAVSFCPPAWSRLRSRNSAGVFRNIPLTKLHEYDVEICRQLWSLWGSLSLEESIFEAAVRGKQHLACGVMACCAATTFPVLYWNSQLLDAIVIHGDRYHCESLECMRKSDGELKLENLNSKCSMDGRNFHVRIKLIACGQLYDRPSCFSMNVTTALLGFFRRFKYGILQCGTRSLAVGRSRGESGGYFIYDCQSRGYPLFKPKQGASYVLRTKQLQMLLYCISVTLSTLGSSADFTLHRVQMRRVCPDLKPKNDKAVVEDKTKETKQTNETICP